MGSDAALPHCFDGFPPRVNAYAEGEWVESAARDANRYRIDRKFWPSIGSKVHADLPQHYGRCDDVQPQRKLYAWRPSQCSLLPFQPSAACKLLAGKQIVIVGDSTVFQTFLSLVHLLGGEFGRDVKHGYVTADLTAAACDGRLRINFIRSDLLLWTHSVPDYHAVQRCDGFTILHPFVHRGRVMLTSSCSASAPLPERSCWREGSVWDGQTAAKKARVGFFARNLNHTLASLLWRRAAWGHKDPQSVVILGTSTPVRGCARFTAPLKASGEAIDVAAGGGDESGNVTSNELRWMQYARFNEVARRLAESCGTSFLDGAAPAARRPAGAVGRVLPPGSHGNGKSKQLDCVHYCLPGVVDTWPTLLYNLLTSRHLKAALGAVDADGKDGGARGSHPRMRFLSANASEWLRVKGYAERFEGCMPSRGRLGACEHRMQSLPWWPFRCIESRDRAARKGAQWSEHYKPWMPPESFD